MSLLSLLFFQKYFYIFYKKNTFVIPLQLNLELMELRSWYPRFQISNTMRKDLLNLYVLVWIGKKLLKFVKNIRVLLNFSKNFSLYWAGKFLLNFSKKSDILGPIFY